MTDVRASLRNARLRLWRLNRRLQPKLARWRIDPLIRQARQLQRAYAGPNGPKVLIFGDSVMMWTTQFDSDRRNLATMIRDILGPAATTICIGGAGYNARIVMSLLTALDGGRSLPEVVIVPVSINTTTEAFLSHYRTSYAHEAEALRSVIARRAWSTRRLTKMPAEEINRFDQQTAKSWFGAHRTYGELDLIMHAKAKRRWQATIRMQCVMDFNAAERLELDGEGPALISAMSNDLRERELPTVGYVGPMNYEIIESIGANNVREHMVHNATVVAESFSACATPGSRLVNAALDFGLSDFGDHLHIKDEGRILLAERLATAVLEAKKGDNG